MIGMFLLQDRKVWNFDFGYFDLFVIWFLAIGISGYRINSGMTKTLDCRDTTAH
jgi:hypothetical protein